MRPIDPLSSDRALLWGLWVVIDEKREALVDDITSAALSGRVSAVDVPGAKVPRR